MADLKGRLNLGGFDTKEDTRPDAALYAVDNEGKVLYKAKIGEKGEFEIPERPLAKAHRIYGGPDAEDFASLDRENLAVFTLDQVRHSLEANGRLDVARGRWITWHPGFQLCADGSVRHCSPYPWVIRDLVLDTRRVIESAPARQITAAPATGPRSARIAESVGLYQPFIPHYRCRPICEGVVEVYRRLCCCRPWVIWDERIPELEIELQEWPEIPIPDLGDPPPFERLEQLGLFQHGALDARALNASRDRAALAHLEPQQKVEYIQARPWLYCWPGCGSATKVGQGFIQPDGTFTVCWNQPIYALIHGCHFEYAFVVKQVIDGQTVVIYDGRAANQWFENRQGVELTSYHPKAIDCDDTGIHDDGSRFAVLERIGDTDSYNLETPLPTSATSVGMPGPNGGLAFPLAGDARGLYRNRNWGGTLPLYFYFSEALRAVARRYRVSVVAANPNGTAAGALQPLADPVAWRRYVTPAPGVIQTVSVPLGPDGNGTFQIPYFVDGPWVGGRYHAHLDTTGLPQGRYLVVLELFDAAGNPVTPNADGFTFRRWTGLDDPMPAINEDALPHLFWWDNRPSQAQIVTVQGGTNVGNAACMFIEGGGSTPIAVRYRAYHPEERFQLRHNLNWWRGIGGSTNSWPLDDPSTLGVDEGEINIGNGGPAGTSQPRTVDQLLGAEPACSFGLSLRTHVKTFNGSSTLDGLEGTDQAAFALTKT